MKSKGMVYFIGAGPGDPDLITVKGKKIIEEADVLLYAGSLVQEGFLDFMPEHARVYNSAGLKLEQQVTLMEKAVNSGQLVVRLHTGDPSIYGAIAEQMKALDRLDIPFQVVPGVSSAFAAAAALKIELTLPECTQTIILTRQSGRTPVPEREALAKLAAHRTSLMIFLSAGMIEQVVADLYAAGYSPETGVAVVYRVTWPDEKIIYGNLGDISQKVLDAEITHHALIVVSPSLRPELSSAAAQSHLYGSAQDDPERDGLTAIISLTRNGLIVGRRLLDGMEDACLYVPQKFLDNSLPDERIRPTRVSIRQTLQSAFKKHKFLICVMASGIVVREIAPLLCSKHADPAVVLVDEAGKFAVSLLSGHKGGANALAKRCAGLLNGQAVITTASDIQGLPALDLLAGQNGWRMSGEKNLTILSGAMVNGEIIDIYQDCGSRSWLPETLPSQFGMINSFEKVLNSRNDFLVCITYRDCLKLSEITNKHSLILHPPCLHVGIGCNRGTPAEEILQAVKETFLNHQLTIESIASIASIDLKADEEGLLDLCEKMGWSLRFFTSAELSGVKNIPNPSCSVEKNVGVAGVSEPAALLAAQAKDWLVEKQKYPNVTVAVTLEEAP